MCKEMDQALKQIWLDATQSGREILSNSPKGFMIPNEFYASEAGRILQLVEVLERAAMKMPENWSEKALLVIANQYNIRAEELRSIIEERLEWVEKTYPDTMSVWLDVTKSGKEILEASSKEDFIELTHPSRAGYIAEVQETLAKAQAIEKTIFLLPYSKLQDIYVLATQYNATMRHVQGLADASYMCQDDECVEPMGVE